MSVLRKRFARCACGADLLCAHSQQELAPPALELANSKPSAPPLGANSSDDSDDDDAADDNNNDKSQYVKDQDRHFQIWIKRRAQEVFFFDIAGVPHFFT